MTPITVRSSPRIFQIMIGCGIILSAIGLNMRTTSPTAGNLTVLIGLSILGVGVYMIKNRKMIYSFTLKGIEYGNPHLKTVPWTEITASKKIPFEGGFYILLKVDKGSRYTAQLTPEERLLPAGAERVGIDFLSLRLTGTNSKPEEIDLFIQKRIK